MLRGAQAPFVGVAASVGAWSELPYPGLNCPTLAGALRVDSRRSARLVKGAARVWVCLWLGGRRGSFGLGAASDGAGWGMRTLLRRAVGWCALALAARLVLRRACALVGRWAGLGAAGARAQQKFWSHVAVMSHTADCCLIATTIDGASSAQVGSLDDGLLRLLCCAWRRRPMCVPGVRRVCISVCISICARNAY